MVEARPLRAWEAVESAGTEEGEALPRSQGKRGWRERLALKDCPCKWNNLHSFFNNRKPGSTCPLLGTNGQRKPRALRRCAGAHLCPFAPERGAPQIRLPIPNPVLLHHRFLLFHFLRPLPSQLVHMLCPSLGHLQLLSSLGDTRSRAGLAPSGPAWHSAPVSHCFSLPVV